MVQKRLTLKTLIIDELLSKRISFFNLTIFGKIKFFFIENNKTKNVNNIY
jgi:hypothetical protein